MIISSFVAVTSGNGPKQRLKHNKQTGHCGSSKGDVKKNIVVPKVILLKKTIKDYNL